MSELRDVDAALRWALGGAALARTTPRASAAQTSAWLLAAVSEIPALPPPGFVLDFGTLLAGGHIAPGTGIPADPSLARALEAYERQLLGRLAADRHLLRAADAFAKLPVALAPVGVAVTLATVLARLGWSAGLAIPAGAVRRLAEGQPTVDVAALRNDPSSTAELTRGYDALVAAASRARTLLTDADVFTLEHLPVLSTLGQRVALADVLDAAVALDEGVPRRLGRARRHGGHVASAIPDESRYPVGGLASIGNHGSFENLVTSELAYLEDGPDIDLFDVRYAQDELLYYTRDEATLVRPRRLCTVVLPAELEGTRRRDPGLRFQRIVMLLAALHVVVAALLRALGDEDVRVVLAFPTRGATGEVLGEELRLCSILFREEIERGVVVLERLEPAEVDARASTGATRGISQVVTCTVKVPEAPSRGPVERASLVVGPQSLEGWQQAVVSLLRQLV